LGSVKYHKLPIDSKFSLRGETLRNAIENDLKDGYYPFYVKAHLFIVLSFNKVFSLIKVCATLGTTSICSFDNILELGPICKYFEAIID
jgi:hypothetical protein